MLLIYRCSWSVSQKHQQHALRKIPVYVLKIRGDVYSRKTVVFCRKAKAKVTTFANNKRRNLKIQWNNENTEQMSSSCKLEWFYFCLVD